jgi:hypothetical protein
MAVRVLDVEEGIFDNGQLLSTTMVFLLFERGLFENGISLPAQQ